MTSRGLFPVEFLRRVAQERIEALLIGRQAMAVYGAPTATNDIDLLVLTGMEEKRLRRLAEEFELVKVLEETGGILYRKRQVRYSDPASGPVIAFRTVDILTIPRLRNFSFESAWKRRVSVSLGDGGEIHLPHVDDLIALKRARNNTRDKEDVAWLRRNRSELLRRFPSRHRP